MSSENEATKSICPYCGVGCGVDVETDEDGSNVNVTGWDDNPVSEGNLCIKGIAADEIPENEDRLTDPMIKEDGEFREADWDEALDKVATELGRIADDYGPDALGFFSSSQCTNEENYLYQKLARNIGTNNIDQCARLCHSSTVAALAESFGMGAMCNSLEDLGRDSDVYWVIGANPAEGHPVAHTHYFKPNIQDGATMIQVDPHENKTSRDAEIHIQNRPGTDISVLNIAIATIIENEWYDEEFIDERSEGFQDLKEELADFDKEAAAEIADVEVEQVEEAAEIYAKADAAGIFTGMGMSQHTKGVDNVQNLINMALITGNVGKPGAGVNPLRGQNNVQGASDICYPDILPGYLPVDDDEERERVEEIWGFDIPPEPGLTHVEISKAMGDSIHGAYVMGENPLSSEPNVNEVEAGFESLEFCVVQDIFMTETAEQADVILPATSWAEVEGTVTNTDRRVQRMRGIDKIHPNTKQDLEILQEVGQRMHGDHWDYDGPEDVFNELREVAPIYRGITYDRIGMEGIQWPCYTTEEEGQMFMYEDEFETDNGLGKIRPVQDQEHADAKDGMEEDYPFVLTTGNIEQHYNTGAMSRRSELLNRAVDENFVDIHPDDAEELGIEDGQMIELSSPRGSVEIRAQVTDATKPGVLWSTPHFSEAKINKLTNDTLDPVSKIPEYKAASASAGAEVDIQPADAEPADD